ncbi:S-layer homology domain-containing protein [Bacillus songklensis]|uniref:S-layer homology domain-containing protein n=1 Tax=Bacillus songklensis TaxID=1069116 RepID=A0ABV8B8A3_9BACI
MNWKKPLLALVLGFQVVASGMHATTAEAIEVSSGTVNERIQVTPGVTYKDIRHGGSTPQAVRVLEMNLADPYTKVEVGVPDPLTKRATVTSQAKADTSPGHSVVGAVNAGFFHFDNNLPAYLLAVNNTIMNLGVISSGFDEYMSVPTAFGMASDGKPLIDQFAYQSSVTYPGGQLPISSINKARGTNEAILYTPQFSYESTRTNTYGMEIVVTNASKPVDQGLKFGEVVTGTVQTVTPYGVGNSTIPKNGFVLSLQGGALAAIGSQIKPGTQLQLTIDMEQKWRNAQYILASGPMLVKDGKVSMTIDPNSSRAKERNPRTAVAVNKDRSKVFFVTADGRQRGYASGMTLSEFAEYLVSLGADRALNLDGGGSTTMAVREPGDIYATLANTPSQPDERLVSTTLEAVSTAPAGEAVTLKAALTAPAIASGGTTTVSVKSALDRYNNVLAVNPAQVSLSVEGDLAGTFNGMTFTATKAGSGAIVVKYGQAVAKLPLTVNDTIKQIIIQPSSLPIGEGSTAQLSVKGVDGNGKTVALNPSVLKWSVSGNAGTISPSGLFTAGNAKEKGTIAASFNSISASIPVTVGGDPITVSNLDDVSQWSSSAARANASIAASDVMNEGSGALKLQYDFTPAKGEIAAAYANANQPMAIAGKPLSLGVWVHGDGKGHWLRGKIVDGNGTEHTINFTEEGGLNWTGWKHVQAPIPANAVLPLTFKQIYVAEASPEKQGTGAIAFDQLQAVYSNETSFAKPLFTDVPNSHWAYNEIQYWTELGVITGYGDGSFKPEQSLKRAHAALLLAKAMKLDTSHPTNPNFSDVPTDHLYYDAIATIANMGIVTGKQDGRFDPNGTLTRAQMAAILTRAYNLTGTIPQNFADVPNDFWAFKEISALAANGITTGYKEDNTFRPQNAVTRAQFSAFLYRILQ